MADTRRTLSALQTRLADNTSGNIFPQDVRDFLVSVYPDVHNVKNYGATGDGSTDDTSAIQTAVNAMSNGEQLFFPTGVYVITSAIDFVTPGLYGIRIAGEGGENLYESTYSGSSIRVDTDAQIGFDFEQSALVHEGPTIENLNFIDNSSSSNAVLVSLDDTNHWTFRNCSFRPEHDSATSLGGTGIKLRASVEDNAWGLIEQCRFVGLSKGIDDTESNGWTLLGGAFHGRDGQTAIYLGDSMENARIFGSQFDTGAVGVHFDGAGSGRVIGCTFEATVKGVLISETGADLRGIDNGVIGCHFVDGANDITNCIEIEGVNSWRNQLIGNTYRTNGTYIVDGGSNTVIMDGFHGIKGPPDHPIGWGVSTEDAGNVNIYQGAGSPEGAKTATVGSMYLRRDGGADSVLYTKESGTGNTGWSAMAGV
jgi:hypothetical protein